MNSVVIDPMLEEKVRKGFALISWAAFPRKKLYFFILICLISAKERISENMHILANEPSLAYYRLQENIRKSLPLMIDRRLEGEKLHRDLQGNIYDLEYAVW